MELKEPTQRDKDSRSLSSAESSPPSLLLAPSPPARDELVEAIRVVEQHDDHEDDEHGVGRSCLHVVYGQLIELKAQRAALVEPTPPQKRDEKVTTYTPILWATLSEEEQYAEYIRVRTVAIDLATTLMSDEIAKLRAAQPSPLAFLDQLEDLANRCDAASDGKSMTDTGLWWILSGCADALRTAATAIARGRDRARRTYGAETIERADLALRAVIMASRSPTLEEKNDDQDSRVRGQSGLTNVLPQPAQGDK